MVALLLPSSVIPLFRIASSRQVMVVYKIYEQYETGMERRNVPEPERSVPIKKPERRPERILQLLSHVIRICIGKWRVI